MKNLIRFQTDRGLDTKPYEPLNEHGNIVEELLESIGLDVPKVNRPELKRMFNEFVADLINAKIAVEMDPDGNGIPLAEQADAYCDIITFATGALLKLGYNPEIAIQECGKEINSRVGTMVDGKFEKDLSPEAQANWYKANYKLAEIGN